MSSHGRTRHFQHEQVTQSTTDDHVVIQGQDPWVITVSMLIKVLLKFRATSKNFYVCLCNSPVALQCD